MVYEKKQLILADQAREDLMELTKSELSNWRSQFATSSSDKMGLRYNPMAFTEQGVAMLSSVLRSKTAIQVNIQIMRVFTKLRYHLLDNTELRTEIENLRADTDGKFRIVFETLDQLLSIEDDQKNKIGYIKEELSQYKKNKQVQS